MTDDRESVGGNPAVRRIVDAVGAATFEALGHRLAGSDLTSLLLEVMSRRAALRSPGDILRQYERDRFTRPAQVDPRALLSMSADAVESLGTDFELVETAPLAPLGTHAVVSGISQNRVVSTIRSTEVAADPTNSLALEAAVRRRALLRQSPKSAEIVRLASIQRVVRGQQFDGPRSFAHFALLGLVSAGRDGGNRRFEVEELSTQVRSLAAVCRRIGRSKLLVQLTDFGGGNDAVIDACTATIGGEVSVSRWPDRPSGRGYYDSVCFKLSIVDGDEVIEVGDGGLVDWTQSLLNNGKERLMISGLSLERLTQLTTAAAS